MHAMSCQCSWIFTPSHETALWACINLLFVLSVRSPVNPSNESTMGQFIIWPWEGRIFNRTLKMGIQKKYYAHGVGLTPVPTCSTSTWQAKSISSGVKKDGRDKTACSEVLCPGAKAWEHPFIQCNMIMTGCPFSCRHSRYQFLNLGLLRDRELCSKQNVGFAREAGCEWVSNLKIMI